MSTTPESLALLNAAHYEQLWAQVPPHLHRFFDGKFQAIDEALQVLEGRANAVYPSITKVSRISISVGSTGNIDTTITGVNFDTDETVISCTIGGQTAAIQAGATANSIVARLTEAQVDALGSAGEAVMLMLRVRGVLCQPVRIDVIA